MPDTKISTSNNPAPQTSTAENILNGVKAVSGVLSIAIPAAGAVVPLITGIVALIRKRKNSQGDVEYTVVLKLGQDELDKVIQVSTDDLSAINAQLAVLGKPPIQGT